MLNAKRKHMVPCKIFAALKTVVTVEFFNRHPLIIESKCVNNFLRNTKDVKVLSQII